MSSGQHTLPRSTWLLLVGLTFGWGLNWPIMKIALAQMPVWSFRSMCVIGGAAGMFLIAWAGRPASEHQAKDRAEDHAEDHRRSPRAGCRGQ